jgi:hypothetical protein
LGRGLDVFRRVEVRLSRGESDDVDTRGDESLRFGRERECRRRLYGGDP